MKQTILVADDSLTIQRLITQTFADADFRIVSVSNGDAAIRKLEEIRPDVVLADIYMPGKNGYEVCSQIKNTPEFAAVPVVLLVGAFDAFETETALKAGASAHIKKPFEPRALVDLVQSLLRGEQHATDGAETYPAIAQAAAVAASAVPDDASGLATIPEEAPSPAAPAFDENGDLLGLEDLFKPPVPEGGPSRLSMTDADIDLIADRVIKKLSTQVIESVAWDVVPDITEKVLRDELKRHS